MSPANPHPESVKVAGPVDQPPSLAATGPCEPPHAEVGPWLLPGDRYRVVGEIARGGMGVVLRAHDASFDRPLAIKVLLPGASLTAEDERRFLEEASITGQLQH